MGEKALFRVTNMRGKHDCGVATLAMLLGRTYEEVLLVAGRISPNVLKKGLYSSDLVKIAGEFGSKLSRTTTPIDLEESTGILGLRFPTEREHFTFLTNGLMFDPQDENVVWDAILYVKKHKVVVVDLLEEEG